MITRFYSKKELAQAAGVERKTLYRWLCTVQSTLARMGVRPEQRLMPPNAVEFICEKFCIDTYKLTHNVTE